MKIRQVNRRVRLTLRWNPASSVRRSPSGRGWAGRRCGRKRSRTHLKRFLRRIYNWSDNQAWAEFLLSEFSANKGQATERKRKERYSKSQQAGLKPTTSRSRGLNSTTALCYNCCPKLNKMLSNFKDRPPFTFPSISLFRKFLNQLGFFSFCDSFTRKLRASQRKSSKHSSSSHRCQRAWTWQPRRGPRSHRRRRRPRRRRCRPHLECWNSQTSAIERSLWQWDIKKGTWIYLGSKPRLKNLIISLIWQEFASLCEVNRKMIA